MDRSAKILIAIWLVIAVFAAFMITDLMASRQLTEQRIRGQALSYARVVEQHASAALDRANIALANSMDYLRPADLTRGKRPTAARKQEIQDLLLGQQQRTAGIGAMALADAEGNILANSLGNSANANLGDREYFQTLKSRALGDPVISETVYGRGSDKWGIQVARRISLPDGSFGGMVVASLGLAETFTDFYSTLALGRDALVAISDREGRLLVRYPVIEELLGKSTLVPGTGAQMLSRGSEGVTTARSSLDNIERVLGFRQLQNFPVLVTVGYSLEDALSVWEMERNSVAAAVALAIIAGGYISFAIRRSRSADEALRVALEDQATHDVLTGLPNRRFAFAWLPYALSSARREDAKVAVLYVDLDGFKEVNDRFGHEAGDLVLKTVAERFVGTLRGSDALVRFGGDEFLVLVGAVESREELATLSTRLIASLEPAVRTASRDVRVGASIGIALYPDNAEGADALVAAADRAMYQAKQRGGNCHVFGESRP